MIQLQHAYHLLKWLHNSLGWLDYFDKILSVTVLTHRQKWHFLPCTPSLIPQLSNLPCIRLRQLCFHRHTFQFLFQVRLLTQSLMSLGWLRHSERIHLLTGCKCQLWWCFLLNRPIQAPLMSSLLCIHLHQLCCCHLTSRFQLRVHLHIESLRVWE